MKQRNFLPFLLTTLLIPASAAEFFVAPNGSDSAPGTRSQPFASFSRAQNAVREYRAGHPAEAVTVTFRPGTYSLATNLVFQTSDSGASAQAPVSYRAEPGSEVIISAGRAVTGWQTTSERPGLWKARVDPQWRFNQLWVNGRRAIRARTPNYWQFATLDSVEEAVVADKADSARHRFQTQPSATAPLTRLNPENLKKVEVLVFHKWDTTRELLAEVSPEKGAFTTVGGKMKTWNKMDRNSLFFFENLFDALDTPGEWFLAGDGWLYYLPQGENMTRADVIAPVQEQFLHILGDPSNPDKWVKNILFDGLKFRYAAYHMPPEGVPPAQAAMNVDATAILLDGARNIRFENCTVEHTGATAFWFRKACRDSVVNHTRIFDVGNEGVRIGETALVPEAQRTGFITVTNCIIQSGGRMFPQAVGVWIGHSADNTLSHCDIGDFFYTAVSVGWRWGYDESGAKRNKIENNHLHHLGYRILSDMGGVYTLGPSEGTVIRNNHIHDVHSTRYGGWGLYPDEGSTGILFENNLVHDVHDGCVHQHYGKSNIFQNNILAFSEQGQVAITRSEPHLSFTFRHNIVFFDEGTLLGYSGWKAGAQVNLYSNLYWRAEGKPFDFAGQSFQDWQGKGRDAGSVIADPLFVDAAKRDFRLKRGSPADKIGFKPFDFDKIGVQGARAWRQLAASTVYPKPYVVPKPAPLRLSDDFETTPSRALSLASLDDEGKKLITLTTSNPAAGKQCLKVTESAGLKAGFNPHFYWQPHYASGAALLQFRIKLEPGSDIRTEWRSEGGAYKTGPNIHLRPGSLSSGGRSLMQIPANEWITVTMTSPLGQTDAKWTLQVKSPDGSTREFKDLPTEAGWRDASWIGFSSQGNDGTSFYLDDLQLKMIQ